MTKRFVLFIALAAASTLAQAHPGLELDGALHQALHAIGTTRLVVMGGVLLTIVVGLVVRSEARKTAERRRRES